MNKTIVAMMAAALFAGAAIYECHQASYYADKDDWCAIEYDDEGNRVDTVLHKNERN